MAGSSLIVGSVKAILEKNSDTIAKKIIKIGKDEWEKFKIDFDISFKKYLENATEKYGMEKTVLNRTKPRYICDFFVYPNLQIGKDVFVGDSINKILSISNFVIIQGGGGTGKSTFLRYLFLDEVSKKDLVPIFIELKTLNSIDGDYDIVDFVFKRLYSLGSTLEKEYMEYALRSGCFLFLFDGYDEIFIEKRERFFQKLEDLCDRFPQNSYILSSRPYSDFIEFQRFALIELQSFTKEQAIEFIQKVEFDLCIKEQFIQELNAYLYEKYRSFASNPLLLSIMLLTFGRYGNIPNKSYLFYANAFETMYSKHDATKSGYHREMRCGLSLEEFKMALAYFCFLSYYQGKVEFTYDEINAIVKKFKAQFPDLKIEDFLYDLVNAVCILIKDGLTYMFIHRSFQEYFTAYFLKEQSDKNMKMLGIKLIKNDCGRAISDDVIALLHDMANERFEENILLPIINEIE